MVSRRKTNSDSNESNRPPAITPEERENQLILAAVDLAEKQLREGTASAQVISHYLKLGSSREKLEQERLRGDISMLETKRELMESEKRTEQLMVEALRAMQGYMGIEPESEEEAYDEYDA